MLTRHWTVIEGDGMLQPPARDPDFVIGDPNDPYLLRWWLTERTEDGNCLYYHRFLRDDDDRALHNHPWPSFSIVVRGTLREITDDGENIYSAGDTVFRTADHSHRMIVLEKPSDTLFFTGPKIQEWGFWTTSGWVHWKDFVDPQNHGQVRKEKM